MEGFEVLVAMVTVLACVLLFFSLVAYRREGSRQLIVISIITGLFLIKGIILSLWIFIDMPDDISDILAISLLIDFVILLLLLVAGFRGARRVDKEPSNKQKRRGKESAHTLWAPF